MIIIQDESKPCFLIPTTKPAEVGITPEAFAGWLSTKKDQVFAIDGWAIAAKVSHITAEATGNVVTMKLYLKS